MEDGSQGLQDDRRGLEDNKGGLKAGRGVLKDDIGALEDARGGLEDDIGGLGYDRFGLGDDLEPAGEERAEHPGGLGHTHCGGGIAVVDRVKNLLSQEASKMSIMMPVEFSLINQGWISFQFSQIMKPVVMPQPGMRSMHRM